MADRESYLGGKPITIQEVMGFDAAPCGWCLGYDLRCLHCQGTGGCRDTSCECWEQAAWALASIPDWDD